MQRCEHTIGANVKMAAVKDSSGLAGLALEEPVRKVETGKRETNINPTSWQADYVMSNICQPILLTVILFLTYTLEKRRSLKLQNFLYRSKQK